MFPRVLYAMIIWVCSSLFLSGCWDRVEVNDLAVVIATSVDKDEDGEYRIGVQVPLVSQLGGSPGSGGGPAFFIDTEKGRTIREAINLLQRRMSRQMIFSHRRILVVSEEVAKEGIHEFFDELSRLPDNRLTTYMIVSKGKAIDLLETTPHLESFSAENMREIVKLPFNVPLNLKDVAQTMNRLGSDPIVPYLGVHNPEKKEKDIEFLGYAQFKWDKMVGVYEGNAAFGANWFQGNFVPYTKTFAVEEAGGRGPITIKIFEADHSINPRINNGKLHFDMKVIARGAVQENRLTADLRFLKNQEKLNQSFARHIKGDIEEFISQAKEGKTDSGQWGRVLARKYPKDWYQTFSHDWDEKMTDITFHIEVDAKVDRLGQITENITKEKREP